MQKKIQFGFRLGLNAIKELSVALCGYLNVFSILFDSTLHSQNNVVVFFLIDAFVLCCHKVFSSIAITVPAVH